MSQGTSHLVFVYGTLKTTYPSHQLLSDVYATFLDRATTVKRWPLVVALKYNVPFILDNNSCGKNVIGEVYRVDDQALAKLDTLEGHPDYYKRRVISVQMMDTVHHGSTAESKPLECWAYIMHDYKPGLLELEHLAEYLNSPPKKYSPPADDEAASEIRAECYTMKNTDVGGRYPKPV